MSQGDTVHIEHTAQRGLSLCGRRLNIQFAFTGLDHAFNTIEQRGRLLACPECVERAVSTLKRGIGSAEEL